MVKVTVVVTVKNHQITDIRLIRHENGKGTPADAMILEMIRQNTCIQINDKIDFYGTLW